MKTRNWEEFKNRTIEKSKNFKWKKLDNKTIPKKIDEIRLFMIVRNENLRLPYVLEYYFNKGVDRAIIIDNGSTDGTVEYLQKLPKVHVFQTLVNFNNEARLIDEILLKYGIGYWCVVVDADELLVVPNNESTSLKDLCRYLDKNKNNCLEAILLDMYSFKRIKDVNYKRGENLLDSCSYYEMGTYTCFSKSKEFPWKFDQRPIINKNICGGMRKRVFGKEICVVKTPVFKYSKKIFLSWGTHQIFGEINSAKIRSVVLHFKFLNDFLPKVEVESYREQHWNNAIEYKAYEKKVTENPNLRIYNFKSILYGGSNQLENKGLILSTKDFSGNRTKWNLLNNIVNKIKSEKKIISYNCELMVKIIFENWGGWINLVLSMTDKELKARYKMALFGFLWIFLNPLLQMLVLGFIFQFFVPIKSANYFEFLFPGLLIWNFFSYTINKNTPMYVNERALIQKAKFPREVIVISVVLSNLVHFLIALAIYVFWEAIVLHELHWYRWWLLPGIVVWMVVLTTGLSLLFSSLNVKWRDINFGVQALMPLWFYATPVLYSLDLLPRWLANWIYINPVTALVEMIRWTTLGLPINWVAVSWSLVVTVIIFVIGIIIFRRESPFFDDWL